MAHSPSRVVPFATSGKTRANHCIRLTVEPHKDISDWFEFLHTFSGALSFLSNRWTSSDVLLRTKDASSFAYGAVAGNQWLQGQFPPSWTSKHITVKPTNYYLVVKMVNGVAHACLSPTSVC